MKLTRRPRLSGNGAPAARNQMHQLISSQQRSAYVNDQLNQVGPNHGRDAAFERVDQRQYAYDDD